MIDYWVWLIIKNNSVSGFQVSRSCIRWWFIFSVTMCMAGCFHCQDMQFHDLKRAIFIPCSGFSIPWALLRRLSLCLSEGNINEEPKEKAVPLEKVQRQVCMSIQVKWRMLMHGFSYWGWWWWPFLVGILSLIWLMQELVYQEKQNEKNVLSFLILSLSLPCSLWRQTLRSYRKGIIFPSLNDHRSSK